MNGQLKSKTNWAGVAVACLGIVEMNAPLIQEMLGQWYGLTYIGIGVAMVVLRNLTTTPVSEK